MHDWHLSLFGYPAAESVFRECSRTWPWKVAESRSTHQNPGLCSVGAGRRTLLVQGWRTTAWGSVRSSDNFWLPQADAATEDVAWPPSSSAGSGATPGVPCSQRQWCRPPEAVFEESFRSDVGHDPSCCLATAHFPSFVLCSCWLTDLGGT